MSGGGLSRWPPIQDTVPSPMGVKNSVDLGDTLHVIDGYQYIVVEDFIFDGELILDGDLIVLESGHQYGWHDMLGEVRVRGVPATDPTWAIISGSVFSGYKFSVNDTVWIPFHVPHDYVPGTDIYIHTHWLQDGTDTNTVKWEYSLAYASGYGRGNFPLASPIVVTSELAASGIAHDHMISESIGITVPGMEVDGFIKVRLRRVTNGGTDNADSIFVDTADIHYLSNSRPTKNRNYNFYD